MKLTKNYIKALIKEALEERSIEEFKGGKPVETLGIMFHYMLNGEHKYFQEFDLKKIDVPGLRNAPDEARLDAVASHLVQTERGGSYLTRDYVYNYIKFHLFPQIPELANLTYEQYGVKPITKLKLASLQKAYDEGNDVYHGFVPVSVEILGGKYKGRTTHFDVKSKMSNEPSEFKRVPKSQRDDPDSPQWEPKTPEELAAQRAERGLKENKISKTDLRKIIKEEYARLQNEVTYGGAYDKEGEYTGDEYFQRPTKEPNEEYKMKIRDLYGAMVGQERNPDYQKVVMLMRSPGSMLDNDDKKEIDALVAKYISK